LGHILKKRRNTPATGEKGVYKKEKTPCLPSGENTGLKKDKGET
jgi:hypothetical protein